MANAVLDGTSALMLSGETAVGDYPAESIAYMDRIARAVEPSLGYRHQIPEAQDEPTIGQAMSNAACDIAEALGAKALLVRPSPAAPPRRSRGCGRGGRSSGSRTTGTRSSTWRSSGASRRSHPRVRGRRGALGDRARGRARAGSSSPATGS